MLPYFHRFLNLASTLRIHLARQAHFQTLSQNHKTLQISSQIFQTCSKRLRMKTLFLLLALGCHSLLLAQLAPTFDSLQHIHSDTIYFSSGSDQLSKVALRQIENFPPPQRPSERIYLTAHTDDVGQEEYNEDLARRRAEAVAEQLSTRAWTQENLLIRTFGERDPIAPNERASGRQRNRRVTLDLYQATPYVKVGGRAVDPEGRGIDSAMVRLHGRSLEDTLYTDQDGRFDLDLPIDSVVGIDIYARDFFLFSQVLKVSARMKKDIDLEVSPAEVGTKADIDNLFFFGGLPDLLPKSLPVLPKLKTFMEVNPHLIIEIAGHVNVPNEPPISEQTTSWKLSVDRAKVVYDYLLENGIPAEQLTYKGYGNHQMRFPRAMTETRMAANRRVEIRIIGKLE